MAHDAPMRLLTAILLLLSPAAWAEDMPGVAGWSVAPGDALPLTALRSPEGEDLSPKLQGHKVVLHYWATWCVPCIAELPAVDRMAGELEAKGVMVVAVSLDRKTEDLRRFLARHGTPAHLVLAQDADRGTAKVLKLSMVPDTILSGPDGRETARLNGSGDWAGADRRQLESLMFP